MIRQLAVYYMALKKVSLNQVTIFKKSKQGKEYLSFISIYYMPETVLCSWEKI